MSRKITGRRKKELQKAMMENTMTLGKILFLAMVTEDVADFGREAARVLQTDTPMYRMRPAWEKEEQVRGFLDGDY